MEIERPTRHRRLTILNQLPTDTDTFSRDRLVSALRRWARFVGLAALLAAGAAFGVSLMLPRTYRATAQLFVAPAANPTVALQEVVLGTSLARSYVQLAAAEVVLRPAMQSVGWSDLKEFQKRVTVVQARDTFVIEISFDLDDPTRAAAAANAIAESFVKQSRSVEAALQGTLTIWQPAIPPPDPESPRLLLNTALGSISGGLLALLVVGGLSYLDDRVTDFERVRRLLGITPLDEIRGSAQPETLAGKLFVRDSPRSPEAEAFLSLRTNISLANVDKRPRAILVTSALPSEGKSVVSANLALAFAQEGTPTILIDADLRRPSQHRLFHLDPRQGLTSIVAGEMTADQLQGFRVGENLVVIPSGPLPPNPSEFLSSNKMTSLIQKLVHVADGCTLVIDSSPVLAVADTLGLSTKVDGCILVIDTTRTHARAVRRALQRLMNVNATVLGAVLNKVSAANHYYGYDYTTREGRVAPGGVTGH